MNPRSPISRRHQKIKNVERDLPLALSFLSADLVKDKLPFPCGPG
jgi:hypothetical protein